MLNKVVGRFTRKALYQGSDTRDMFSSLRRVNLGSADQLFTGEETENIKRHVAAFYDAASQTTPKGCWNWGYHDERLLGEIADRLGGYDRKESDSFSEQLYYFTLKQLPLATLKDQKILEVGCGGGEGLNFLSRLEPHTKFVGLDLSQSAIRRASERLSRADVLRFVQGDAESLPFGDAEFDAVLNVESAHNYPNLGRFFAEVQRVLKPGGYFSFVDCLTTERLTLLERCKQEATALKWLNTIDISSSVRAAIRQRMDPNSLMRTTVRNSVGFTKRLVTEQITMFIFGAKFLDGETNPENSSPTMFKTYRHELAVRANHN